MSAEEKSLSHEIVKELQGLHTTAAPGKSPLEAWEKLKAAAEANGLNANIERGRPNSNESPYYLVGYTDKSGRNSAIQSALGKDGETFHDSAGHPAGLSQRDVALLRTIAEAETILQNERRAARNVIEHVVAREADTVATETVTLDDAGRQRLAALRARDRESIARQTSSTLGHDGQVSERFITALDKRLEKSDLPELGWKGREDLNDVMSDMRKLAAVDFQRASDLWSKYRPDDKDKPAFLDSDELAEGKRRAPPSAALRDGEGTPEFVVPEQVRKRFIQADNRYYYRHDDTKLAFEDRGSKLATEHNDPVVALSMVQTAQAKGWQSIRVKGSEEFKREVWLQASLKGIESKGYEPRDVDVQKLAEMQKELGTTPAPGRNIVERQVARAEAAAGSRPERAPSAQAEGIDRASVVDEPHRSLTPAQRSVLDTVKAAWRVNGASEREIDVAAAATVERFQNQRVYVGKVVERGEAPFENDPRNETNFYVKLDTSKGEKVVWGVDLKRALREGGIKDGDDVVVANQGRQPVEIKVKDRDENGQVVGTSSLTTNRNTWRVETLDSLREEAVERIKAKAAHADRAPLVPVHDRAAERAEPRPDVTIEQKRGTERVR